MPWERKKSGDKVFFYKVQKVRKLLSHKNKSQITGLESGIFLKRDVTLKQSNKSVGSNTRLKSDLTKYENRFTMFVRGTSSS